tara:strand:- start:906 stop:1151 length:246 start_codon:yes stop_codon:yes gene_type:complete
MLEALQGEYLKEWAPGHLSWKDEFVSVLPRSESVEAFGDAAEFFTGSRLTILSREDNGDAVVHCAGYYVGTGEASCCSLLK